MLLIHACKIVVTCPPLSVSTGAISYNNPSIDELYPVGTIALYSCINVLEDSSGSGDVSSISEYVSSGSGYVSGAFPVDLEIVNNESEYDLSGSGASTISSGSGSGYETLGFGPEYVPNGSDSRFNSDGSGSASGYASLEFGPESVPNGSGYESSGLEFEHPSSGSENESNLDGSPSGHDLFISEVEFSSSGSGYISDSNKYNSSICQSAGSWSKIPSCSLGSTNIVLIFPIQF